MKRENILSNFFPKFAYIPVLCVIVMNFITYTGTKYITEDFYHYNFSTPLDEAIPFLPCFMFFYILSYLQWYWNYTYHTRLGREKYYHIVTADLISKVIALICFLVFPATLDRPEVTGNGFWDYVTSFIYFMDTPTSLMPSIHCIESWLCFRAALMLKGAPRWYAPAQFVFTLFVFASTVFVKQHFVVDIFAGVAAIEIALFLSKHFKLWRIFSKIELRSLKERSAVED